MTGFKEKAEIFNSHFATQCFLISNSSKLQLHIHYLTDNCLSCVSFCQDKIAKVIQNLDPNKIHCHDNISIRMLKVCGLSIYKPSEIIFNNALKLVFFRVNGERVTLFLFTERGRNKHWKTTVQCRCYQFVGKFLRD